MVKNRIPVCVVGLQWGDEGKGKIVDNLSRDADFVVRFQGGNNAGHTVVAGGKTYKFHHLPSGAVYGKTLLIAQGCVVNPSVLLEEISLLKTSGVTPDLRIDPRVHIVMPYHMLLDAASEKWKGKGATGSLKLGIGYCYEDKNNRQGIRFEDLLDKKILENKIKQIFPLKKKILEKVYGSRVSLKPAGITEQYHEFGRKLKKYLCDTSGLLWETLGKKDVLFEAAHGTFLDVAFGTYPYTVAPYSTSGAMFTGAGIGPMVVDVVGVVKAYTTRVGNGPFPAEQKNDTGEYLQRKGSEFGTTSGRKRRCGWLDMVMVRTAVRLSNVSSLAVTKLDVLSGLPDIKVVDYYREKSVKNYYFPSGMNKLAVQVPVYRKFSGWPDDISRVKKYSRLPSACRKFLEFLQKESGAPVKYISVGPDRDSIIKIN